MIQSRSPLEVVLSGSPVLPLLTVTDVDAGVKAAKALVRGGLNNIEVALRSENSVAAIRAISTQVPNATVGAGTVLNPEQMEVVAAAGARFCVSPGSTPELLEAADELGMPFLPGAATATEVLKLLQSNVNVIKFFPARSAGGPAMLHSLYGPMPQAHFCPTGGIDRDSVLDYLSLPNVLCVGGSWVCPQEAIDNGEWPLIESLARHACRMAPPKLR